MVSIFFCREAKFLSFNANSMQLVQKLMEINYFERDKLSITDKHSSCFPLFLKLV